MTIKLIYRFKNSDHKNESFDNTSKLVDFLKKNTNITSLYLSDNNLGKGGAEALVFTFKKMKSLISLDLSGNNLGTEGTEALISALQETKNLASLDLSGNNLGIEDARKVAIKLPGCTVCVDEKFYIAQKFDTKPVAGLVLGAVIGGVIAYAFGASTLGIVGGVAAGAAIGALLGPLVLYCIAKVCEKVMTKFDDADFTQHTGKEKQPT